LVDALLAIAAVFGKELAQITGEDLEDTLLANVLAFEPLEDRS
jgi:hypothetical protein